MFAGEIAVGDVVLPVHVLNNGQRVIGQRGMVRVLSPAGRESGDLRAYFDRIPSKSKDLDLDANFVLFGVPGTQFVSHGYKATFLVDICHESSMLLR